MARVVRIDSGTAGSVERTPEGGLRVAANFTRVGVLPYSDGERSWSELRPPEEVFADDSLASLRGRPATDLHPPERKVTAENWKRLSIGHVGDDVGHDGQFVTGHVRIEDAAAVQAVDAGDRKDLSCGYNCELDPTPGEFQGQHYDAVQRKIRYNHVALLPPGKGRAGGEVSLRLDGAAIEVSRPSGAVHRADAAQGNAMKTIKIKGKAYRVDDDGELAQAQGAADAGASAEDKLTVALAAAEDKAKALLAELAGVKAALDAKGKGATVDDEGDMDEDDVPDDVMDALLELRATHAKVCGKPPAKGVKASDVRKAIIAKIAPTVKTDAMDAVTAKGMYLGIVAGLAGTTKVRGRNDALTVTAAAAAGVDPATGKAVGQPDATRADEADPVAAANAAQKRSATAWQKPTSYGRKS